MALMVMKIVMAIVRKEIKSETENGDGDGDHVQLYMLETTNYNLTQIYRSVFTPLFSIRYILMEMLTNFV